MNKHPKAALVLMSMVLISGCSQQAVKSDPGSAEEIVGQRAQSRWDLLLKRDYMAAYEYYTPGFRAITPADVYSVDLRSSPVRWTSARLQAVECSSADYCEAEVMVDASVLNMLEGADRVDFTSKVTEEWILLDGQWYYSR